MSYNDYGHPTDPNVGLPPGWIARWDGNSQHWFYINENTGETQWDRPRAVGYGPPAGPPPGAHQFDDRGYHTSWEQHQDNYAAQPEHAVPEEPKKSNKWGYAAAGVGAGLLGGLLLEHEGHEIKDDIRDDVQDAEYDVGRAEYDVGEAPEAVAGWAGRKVGDVEQDYDDVKYDVEDAPEAAAGWVGEKVGRVDQDFDNVDDAYDEGKYEGRYEAGDGYGDGDDRW